MSQVHQRGPTAPEMNITPLIDVVFLLIIFFMLVNKIVSDETVQMVVPELTDAKTYDLGELDKISVSVAPVEGDRGSNPLNWNGEPQYVQVGSQRFELGDLPGITAVLADARAKNEKVEVNLRADAALYFEAVQPVMTAITEAKIGKINLVAYLPEEGPVEPPSDQ